MNQQRYLVKKWLLISTLVLMGNNIHTMEIPDTSKEDAIIVDYTIATIKQFHQGSEHVNLIPRILDACRMNRAGIALGLLNKGNIPIQSDITNAYEYNYTPLLYAVMNNNETFARDLLAKGAKVNETDRYLNTPLHKATTIEMATILIEAGANFNAKNRFGNTILDCHRYQRDMVEFLKSKGATAQSIPDTVQ